jgi:hypothetical protein
VQVRKTEEMECVILSDILSAYLVDIRCSLHTNQILHEGSAC